MADTIIDGDRMATYLLSPGDIMLFRPQSFFGSLIAIKTWHKISHVELYDGQQMSLASRDGLGVGKYPVRTSGLSYVLRPAPGLLDMSRVRTYFLSLEGTPYGWLDLLDFMGVPVDRRGIVCSPFVAGCLRAGGWNVFPTDVANKVAPFQFLDLVGAVCGIAYDRTSLPGK